jgi:hypothetical protein
MTNSDPALVNTSSAAVIQTLKWVRRLGFKPVPLRKRSKAALDEKYVDPNYQPQADSLWQTRDIGVGVVTGPKHSGPIDVDLDCAEAVYFAARFLPPTPAVFGRKSKPRSHYLYRVEEAHVPKIALLDPIAKSCMVELRADGGHQTVLPGSIHEDTGELVEWADAPFPDVTRVDLAVLDKAVKKIAIATLVARHMWMPGQRNEVCKHLAGMFFYLEWTVEETTELVQSVMEYSGDDDRTRLKTVVQSYKKGDKGGKVTGANTLRLLLGSPMLVDRILEYAGSQTAAFLQDYNERFAVVTLKGKFRVAETTALEKGGPPILFGKMDFLDSQATDTVTIEGKRVPKAALWLANPRRRAYRAMDFVPGEEDTGPVLNLWTGWGVEPKSEGSCAAWLELLYGVICGRDDQLFAWMLNWFANIIREPKSKTLTAPVLIGRQGAGKSLLLSYFGKLLGPSYMVVTNEEHIYGRFNKHLATTLLLHSEEALYGGDRKHRGIIKSLITDEYRIFEQKGVDAERIHNYLRLVLTSNEVHAAPAEVDDRRFTVINLGDRKGDSSHFKAVIREMNDGGPAKLLHYILNDFKYEGEIPRTNIKNDDLAEMKFMNMDPAVAWWHDNLHSGQLLPEYLSWASKPKEQEWPQVVSSTALHMAMRIYCKQRNSRYVPDATAFSILLNKMTGAKLERRQSYFANPLSDTAPHDVRLLGTKHYTIMNMVELAEARAAFARYVGQVIEWPAEADKDERPAHTQF